MPGSDLHIAPLVIDITQLDGDELLVLLELMKDQKGASGILESANQNSGLGRKSQ